MSNSSMTSSTTTAKSRRILFPKRKSKERPVTILRAVPQTPRLPVSSPLSPLELAMATSPNKEILHSIGRASPPASLSSHSSPRFLQTATQSTRPRASSNSAVIPQSATTIGVYKHGQIQWQPPSLSPKPSKSRRPKIQVIIPHDRRNNPLPTLPFFNKGHQIQSATAELVSSHEVSPPSGKIAWIRDSVVSPLTAQVNRPPRHFSTAHKFEVDRRLEAPHSTPALSNSSEDSHGEDNSSVYSQHSSTTSVHSAVPFESTELRRQTAITAFSMRSPPVAGVFDVLARDKPESEGAETAECIKTPEPHRQRRYAHHPPIEQDTTFQPTCPLRLSRENSNNPTRQRISSAKRISSNHSARQRSLDSLPTMGAIDMAITRAECKNPSDQASPTLSQAAHDLEKQLSLSEAGTPPRIESDQKDHFTALTDDDPFKWDEVVTASPSTFEDPTDDLYLAPPPVVPRKSSKRVSQHPHADFRLSRVAGQHVAPKKTRPKSSGLTISIPTRSSRLTESFTLSPIPAPPKSDIMRLINPEVAENVILGILKSLQSFDDLFATAVLNRGFYRVFKRHELSLMKATLRKMSPPAWEHREICYPGHDQEDPDLDLPRLEYTPTNYLQYYLRDLYIIAALKSLIRDKCATFLRQEMAVALLSSEEADCKRVDDALWRIWTFCKIFGCGKSREEDIMAQLDWLKGGELVHQNGCRGTIFSADSIDTSEIIANAPECFALGNEGGLTATQLYDMTELWQCLGVLLQPFEGRTIQAREYGVYENTDVRGGDIDGEEQMLDEWYYYLLTLGLSPILELATPCRQSDPSAFILAREHGWMNWPPPVFGGSRRNFLKEAVSRVYEEKIAIAYASSSKKEVQREASKLRMQKYVHEIRRRKNTEQIPEVRMSQERPMSEWEDVMERLTKPRPPLPTSNLASHIPSLRSEAPDSVLPHESVSDAETVIRPLSPPRRIVAEPLLPTPPPSTVPSQYAPSGTSSEEHPALRHAAAAPPMPSLQEHPMFAQHRTEPEAPTTVPPIEEHPAFQQHPLQREIYQSDLAENTAEKAVFRIVEMGFTPDQAKHALRVTDLGDGLRVDRAVELLLRGG